MNQTETDKMNKWIEREMEKDAWREYHALGKEAEKTSKKFARIIEKLDKMKAQKRELEIQLDDLKYQHRRANPDWKKKYGTMV